MGSSLSSGYYAEQARKASEERCLLAPKKGGRQHKAVAVGHSPSRRVECKYCGKHLGYTK